MSVSAPATGSTTQVVSMRQLLESGVHFGHQTRRWNPKMKRFIFTERNGIYIIDLQQSLSYIDRAYEFIKETVSHGGSVMFVGTKKQAQEAIAEQATRVGMPYVNQRWLGGMLTNFQTVHGRLQRLKELEQLDFDDVPGSGMTKKELLVLRREKDKLTKTLGGIRDMSKIPSAVWIIDTKKEHIAVGEAHKLHIPVVAILDTNCDPDEVDYKIPGNDDAIRSVTLLTRVIADAVADGLMARARAGQDSEEKPADGQLAGDEPLAAWEQELLQRGTAAEATPAAEETTDGAGAETATAAPAAAEPAVAEPAVAEPAAAEPAAAEPAAAEPAAAAPGAAEPDVAEPVAAAPAVAEPVAAAPAATEPAATDAPAGEPEKA
jgi:small subunit ribosomal protein S2